MKNEVGRELRKNKAKDTTQHRVVGSDRRVRQRKGAPEIEKEVSHLHNCRTGDRMAMATTPRPVDRPLCLIIYFGRSATAVGKLTSHCLIESEMTCGSLNKRYVVS